MLEKILATLPYNPNAVRQLAFYSRRLHQEKSIRQLGLVFILLTFFVQFFAFISPPQPTMARSNNDIIDGGFGTLTEAVSYCTNNINSFQTILAHYGISCSDLSKTQTVTLKSTDYNRQLYSMGRLPYGKTGETPVNIAGKTYYMRYLWSWDTGPYSSYKVLKGVSSITGKAFFILYKCGNLTFVSLPAAPLRCTWNASLYANDKNCHAPVCSLDRSLPADSPRCQSCPYDANILKSNPRCIQCPYPGLGATTSDNTKCIAPCPYDSSVTKNDATCKPCSSAQTQDDKTACLELSKVVSNLTTKIADANGTTANTGDTIMYTLTVKNTGKAIVPKFVIQENMSDVLDYADIVNLDGGTQNDQHIVVWSPIDIAAGQSVKKQITVIVKTTLPNTPVSSTDPGHYDSVMTNVYGNTTNVNLPLTPAKTAEQLTATLPATGPGTGIILSFLVTLIATYYFARTRLLNKETCITIDTQTTSGGL